MDAARVAYGRYVPGTVAPDAAYDKLAPIYDNAYLSPKDVAENRWMARYLDKRGYCDGRVLDVGCGTGLLLDLCAIQPQWYVGVDVSESMVATARSKHPHFWFTEGDMTDLPRTVSPSSVDNAIYMFGVFSYAINQAGAIESLAHVLRRGGRFFVMALSHRYPERGSYSVAQAGMDVPIVTYDTASLRALFEDSGYFWDLRVRGLSLGVDRLNWMGGDALSAWYHLDAQAGLTFPDKGAYICIEGRRR